MSRIIRADALESRNNIEEQTNHLNYSFVHSGHALSRQ